MSTTRIRVSGECPYEVVVGSGVLGELPAMVGADAGIVRSDPLRMASARPRGWSARSWRAPDTGWLPSEIPDGEAAKDIAIAAGLWSRLGSSPSSPAPT